MIRKKVDKKKLALSVSVALVIIFFLTFYIWHQSESVRLGYRTRDLQVKIERLEREIEKLETQKASLLSLVRVEQMARQELMMVTPKEEQVIYDDSVHKN
ncbi:MAG: cell division protein FtsL [Candidatus Aminicenantes bacterium]|jgi:cell division protein FtsL